MTYEQFIINIMITSVIPLEKKHKKKIISDVFVDIRSLALFFVTFYNGISDHKLGLFHCKLWLDTLFNHDKPTEIHYES